MQASNLLTTAINPTGQVTRAALSIRGHLKRIGLADGPNNKRGGYHVYDEDQHRIGFMTVGFDEAAVRSIQAFCISVRTTRLHAR